MEDPVGIYQGVLDQVSAAVMAADPATARPWFQIPYTMRTLGGEFTVRTEQDFDTDLLSHAQHLHSQGVTDYVRLCRRARYLTIDCIAGAHVTHTLRNAFEVVPPYDTRMILIRGADRWRVAEAEHDVLNDRWPFHWLSVPDRGPTGSRGLADEAQAYLDAMSIFTLAGDWPRYRDHVDLPFYMTSADGNSVVDSEGALKTLFDNFHAWVQAERITEFVRIVRAAWPVENDLLSAIYDTHVVADGARRKLNSPSQIVLRRRPGGGWRAASIQTPQTTSRWTSEATKNAEA
jgi:hypothetical protein